MAKKHRREPYRIAYEVRAQMRMRGQEFTQADYQEALYEALNCFEDEAYADFVRHIAEKVDKESAEEAVSGQPNLPGMPWDLEGDLRLGDGRRIGKQFALWRHVQEAMALDDANIIAVQQANLRKRQEMIRLRPYWDQPGVTKRDAVDAYEAEHPPGQAS
jgi:hypothetical protein